MLPPPTTIPTWTPRRWTSRDLAGDERAERRIDAVGPVAEERLAGQLEQDPLVAEPVPRSVVVEASLTAPPRARSG